MRKITFVKRFIDFSAIILFPDMLLDGAAR